VRQVGYYQEFVTRCTVKKYKKNSKYHFWSDRMGRSWNDIRELNLSTTLWPFTQLVSMQGGQKLKSK